MKDKHGGKVASELIVSRVSAEERSLAQSQLGMGSIWRADVRPCRTLLRHCVLAAQGLGKEALDSFLDVTVDAQGRAVRSLLVEDSGLMLETSGHRKYMG